MHKMIVFMTVSLVAVAGVPANTPDQWESLATLNNARTRLQPALWAEYPRLNANSTVTIMEANGPGVITAIHASALGVWFGKGFDSEASQQVIIRVYYDGETRPSIEMPFMDFLADIQCRSTYFSTVYFSKVKESHNFRLPMPFRKSIRIELENDSETNLLGYVDVQWDEIPNLPDNCGYLYVDYRQSGINPQEDEVLFEADGPVRIAAHWLQYESPISEKGETICEANQELYLDGDSSPTLNYLGTEDVYGYSWGYKGTHSDGWMAILRQEDLDPTGSLIAVLRCRVSDAVSFQKSCRWILTFAKDPKHQKRLGSDLIPYRHSVYYYALPMKAS